MDALKKALSLLQGAGNFVAPATTRSIESMVKGAPNLPDLYFGDEKKKKQAIKNISGMDATPENANKIMNQAQEKMKDTSKSKTELLSFMLPFGAGKNVASKFLVPGALTGAAQADANNTDMLSGAVGGAVGGGLIGGAGNLAGKALGAVGSKLAETGENLGLRRYGLTKMDVNKLGDKLGQPVQNFLKENNLIGKGVEDLGGVIKPLQESFDKVAGDSNLKVNSNDLLEKFAQKIQALKGEAAPELQKKGADLEQYATNLFDKMGDSPNAPAITNERRTIDNLVKDFANSGDAVNASKNRVIRDILQGSVQDAAQGAGVDLKGIGNQLNKLYTFEDIASKRAPQATGAPAGLLKMLGLSAGSGIGGALGGIPGAVAGSMLGMAAEGVANNPKNIQMAANTLPKIGSAMQTMTNNPLLKQILGQTSSRIGQSLVPSGPDIGTEDKQQGDNSPNNIQNNTATSNPTSVPQQQQTASGIAPDMAVTLPDGTTTTYGDLQQKGTFQSADAQEAQSPISDEQWQQLFIQDLITNGGRNIDKLKTVQSLISPQEDIDTQLKQVELATKTRELSQGKPLTGDSEKNALNAVSGLRSTKAIEESLGQKGTEGWSQIAPDFLGGDQSYQSSKTNLSDVIGRLRSGGAIGVEEEKRFNKLLPSPLKGEKTNKKDLAELKTLLGQFADPRKADQANAEFLQTYLGIQ